MISPPPCPWPAFVTHAPLLKVVVFAANAPPATPNDMLRASMSAVINNAIRFFIFSHPLSLIVLGTISPKRETHGGWRHMLKPHPFCYVGG